MGCLKEGTWHCGDCRQKFRPLSLTCIVCEQESGRGLTCDDCQSETFLRGVVSAGSYRSVSLRRGVHWLKFKRVRAVAEPLATQLVPRLTAIAPIDQLEEMAVLVPIPLHMRRARMRGFNQSEDLVQRISELTDIPVVNGLVRTRSTLSQSKLPLELREQNIADAFDLQGYIPSVYKVVILVDDVTTSGSTLSAAARVFPRSVAVWAATVARG